MAKILPIRRKTLSNQSINKIKPFAVCIAHAHFRKGSKTNKTKSVLNRIHFKKTGSSDDLVQLEATEYSEIAEEFMVR